MLCLIDNYDSFTYNITQYLAELGEDVRIVKNDETTINGLREMPIDRFVISPGPCTPNESGISLEVLRHFAGQRPILGICLGHEAIGQVFGGKVVHARSVMHGKVSDIYHDGKGVFQDLPSPFKATRYHSLVVELESLPDSLEISAWTRTPDGQLDEIMALRHKHHVIEGVQFHPEAILTEHGHELLRNFCQME
jgi:anthranilate synthase component II